MVAVGMLSNLFPPVASGSSTQCSGLARALVERGHEVVAITARLHPGAPAHEVWHGVQVHRLPCLHLPRTDLSLNFPWLNATLSPGNLRQIAALLDRYRVEVVHVHNHMFDLALAGAVLARRTGRKLVVTVHTIIKHRRPLYDLLLGTADRLLLKRTVIDAAQGLLCPDCNVDRYVRARFGRQDGSLVPYGVDLPATVNPELVADLRREHQLAGRRVILSLGHVHSLRNRFDLVRAMPVVRQAIPEALLLVVGSLDDPAPAALAARLGVGDAVRFAGAQPHERIPAYRALAELEAHWLNQDEPEHTSLGLATMEAMLAGKCCLAAANVDTFGPGVLEDGRHFVVVRDRSPAGLGSSLVGLLRDPARVQAIGAQAAQLARSRFCWDAVVEATLAAYARA